MGNDNQMTTQPPRHNAKSMQRVADAWSMRVRGATWDEIASTLGYANGPNALRAVRNLAGTLPEPQMPELRSLWRERLEFLWPIAVRDVEAGKPGGMRSAVAVAQRAAQLDGLDQPQRVEVSASSAELTEMVRALVEAAGQRAIEEASIWDDDEIEDADVVEDG